MDNPNDKSIRIEVDSSILPFPTQYGDCLIAFELICGTPPVSHWFGIPVTGLEDEDKIYVMTGSLSKHEAFQLWIQFFQACGIKVDPAEQVKGFYLATPTNWHFQIFHQAKSQIASSKIDWTRCTSSKAMFFDLLTKELIQTEVLFSPEQPDLPEDKVG